MLTPGTITVNFTANYAGAHRICWRQCGVGSYSCTNIVECAGGGNVCSVTISVMVDPESCDPVCFEGYIQATCNAENSSEGRVPWTTSFTPNPVCKMYEIACNNPSLPCAAILPGEAGLNCNGTARIAIGPVNADTSIFVCGTGTLASLPAGYTMSEVAGACCYECAYYQVALSLVPGGILDGSSIYYIDCDTRELTKMDLVGDIASIINICAVAGSISLQLTNEVTGTITPFGNCPA